jgi:hypothetical protein
MAVPEKRLISRAERDDCGRRGEGGNKVKAMEGL